MLGRLCQRCVLLLLVSAVVAVGVWWGSGRMSEQLRVYAGRELEERGLNVDFGALGLTLTGGVEARDVRIYNDETKVALLASVDRLGLDFDYGELLRGEVRLRSIELAEANVSLPVDPAEPELTVLELTGFSAEAFLGEKQLEVRRARGQLAGIDVVLKLVLRLGRAATKEERERALERLALVRQHRQQIQRALDWLGRFSFSKPPQLTLSLEGDTARLDQVQAEIEFLAESFSYPGYECKLLAAEIGFDGRFIDLQRVSLQDEMGELNARASWMLGGEEMEFQVVSSANLPAVADALLKFDALREVVFYDQGPRVSVAGTWGFGGGGQTVDATGEVQCGRFTSRGEVFGGMSAQFGVKPGGIYIRNGLLRHRLGSLAVDWLSDEAQGMKHRTVLKLDPNVFSAFLPNEEARQTLQRFSFQEDSNIFVRLEGEGPTTKLGDLVSRGVGEFRGISHRGVEYEVLDCNIEMKGKRLIFTEVKAQRPDGPGEVDEVVVDLGARMVKMSGVRIKCDPVPVVATFAPSIAGVVKPYRLPSSTITNMDGEIWWKEPEKNDFRIGFACPADAGYYTLLGEEYRIEAPIGELTFRGVNLDFDVRGRLYGGALQGQGRVDLRKGEKVFEAKVKADRFRYGVFGKTLDFLEGTAEVTGNQEKIRFEVGARLLDGDFKLAGSSGVGAQPALVEGEVRLDAVSFSRFAEIYASDYETEGDLSGHFRFEGPAGDWGALRGEGVAIIVNGNLYAVPIVGPLTPLLGSILPTPIKGYNVAKEANCTFRVADGKVTTDDLEALTATFRLVAEGTADYVADVIDFDAQARFRGLPGLVFRPFSELLQYRGTGSIGEPNWKPSLFDRRESGVDAVPEVGREMPVGEERTRKRTLFERLMGTSEE